MLYNLEILLHKLYCEGIHKMDNESNSTSNQMNRRDFVFKKVAVSKVTKKQVNGDLDARGKYVKSTKQADIAKGKSGSKIIVYSDAEHGFFADYRTSYNKIASDKGLRQMLNWIKSH